MRVLLFLFFLITTSILQGDDFFYFKKKFGHLHTFPKSYSASAAQLQCGDKVKKEKAEVKDGQSWLLVNFKGEKGFLRESFLQKKAPQCLQQKYPKFFSSLLDLEVVYYWGRLNDYALD